MCVKCHHTSANSIPVVLYISPMQQIKIPPLWLLENPPLFTVMLTRLCQLTDWASASLCAVKTHSHRQKEKTHCFSRCLNSSLCFGCVANERKDAVYFMTQMKPTQRRSRFVLTEWKNEEEKRVHCCKICMEVHWEPAKYVHAHWKECSLFYYEEGKCLPVGCPS